MFSIFCPVAVYMVMLFNAKLPMLLQIDIFLLCVIIFAGTFTFCSIWEDDCSWSICWCKTNMEKFLSVLWYSLYLVINTLLALVTKFYKETQYSKELCILNLTCFRCMLHNFGGNIEMYGTLDSISSGPVDARVSANSTMVLSIFPVSQIHRYQQ